ncbi:MAG: acyl-CoA dehydrogenase [Pseudomonadaceae bacterium]|nr:acyl-CoA dehydrogenase [Pseudomonadaceae bacterium]
MTSLLLPVAAAVAVLGIPALRRPLISSWAIGIAGKQLPTIGETERIALEAGTVWWEGDLFSGKPNWRKLTDFKVRELSEDEQEFLNGPTEKLCSMLDDFDIAQRRDLPPAVWTFIKKNKFFGMIIPKEHGGLGFSAAAHSAVVAKISSVSFTAAVTVMVPNSLGPGELLLRYGTKAQKDHYLRRLATGEEIPCFGLTEPHAGSDAANGKSFGVVAHGTHNGKKTLGIKLTFSKRYITLAPVATVVGLAFRLTDPNHLLGDADDLGITLALLPRKTKGLVIGKRHDPMGAPFQNGPVEGREVFIPMDYIIGGKPQIGNGWRMLMECLSAGRGISLPSLSVGAAQLSTRAISAYGLVREQFGLPIAKFEGVRERMADTFANTYMMNATRRLTAGAVDAGEHPSVASAIAKAYLTEGARAALNNGMDIMAGAAICKGPKNIFARIYSAIPIGITVEGANILTRSLIVFGQGAIRCHPYLQDEVAAIQGKDVAAFDKAIFGHLWHTTRNGLRAFGHAVTFGHFVSVPESLRPYRRHVQKLTRLSAAFAFAADMGLLSLGGALKRKEYLSGRYADAFAWLYLASATLKQAHDDGFIPAHKPLVDWVLTKAEYEIEQALKGVLANLPNRLAAWKARALGFPFGFHAAQPTDRQNDKVVDAVMADDGKVREALTTEIAIPDAASPGLGQLEDAYRRTVATAEARKKLTKMVRLGTVEGATLEAQLAFAVDAKLLDKTDAKALFEAHMARDEAIQVAAFSKEDHAELK